MAKTHTKILNLEGKTCRLGKISNNLERHGEDYVTAFTLPFTELMLTKAELNSFMRDKLTHTSWFDTSKGNAAAEPMAWWGGESFYLSESFQADRAAIIVSGDRELEFESSGDPKEDDYRPAMVISKLVLTPQVGGMVEARGSLYLRPGIGKTNLALQDHQHREVKLTLVNARVTERDKKQPQLPMGEPGSEPAPAATEGGAAAAATH